MPGQEIAYLWQPALLWPIVGYDQYGQPQVAATPTQLGGMGNQYMGVRWEASRAQVLDAKGNQVTLDAQAMVALDIYPGSWMWLGLLSDWYGTGSAHSDQELMYVVNFKRTGDINNRWQTRTVGLKRLHNSGTD